MNSLQMVRWFQLGRSKNENSGTPNTTTSSRRYRHYKFWRLSGWFRSTATWWCFRLG